MAAYNNLFERTPGDEVIEILTLYWWGKNPDVLMKTIMIILPDLMTEARI